MPRASLVRAALEDAELRVAGLQTFRDYPSILEQGTAWYRSDRIGFPLNGSTVSKWQDLTGNGNTATQGTEANQPTYTQDAIGGKPGLTFDGSSDHMRADSIASVFSGDDPAWSIAVATKPTVSGTSKTERIWACGRESSTTPRLYMRWNDAGVGRYRLFTQDDAGTAAELIVDDASTVAIHVFVCSGTTISWWINGTKKQDGAAFNVGQRTLDLFALGAGVPGGTASNHFDGIISEVPTWSEALSDSEVATVGQYMANRYGRTW